MGLGVGSLAAAPATSNSAFHRHASRTLAAGHMTAKVLAQNPDSSGADGDHSRLLTHAMVAARPIARWSLISITPSIARSSHGVAATNEGLCLIHGGELKPRSPVDTEVPGAVRVFHLSPSVLPSGANAQQWRLLRASSSLTIPEPRVGGTTVWSTRDRALYLWGGRGGIDMSPLGSHQAGLWKGVVSNDSIIWGRIDAVNEDEAPEHRSYHTSIAHKDNIYIHAGCPSKGRSSTLHAFNIQDRTWRSLAAAPEPARGGTALAATTLKQRGDILLRFGGFAGYELPFDNTCDIYTIHSDTWSTVVPAPDPEHGYPGARSVHGFTSFRSRKPGLSGAVVIMWHGEGDASSLGHAGAGKFWDDIWMLFDLSESASGGEMSLGWKKVEVPGNVDTPEGRGWFPGAEYVGANGESRIVMFGGLLSSNERSGELWILDVD